MALGDWLRPGSRATERSAPNPRAHDIRGVYFTCLLDDRSCAACRISDDGLLRRMDEPSRIQAPHPQCTSVYGCRCMNVAVLVDEAPPAGGYHWSAQSAAMDATDGHH
jgi:hypothetical protein